MCNDTFKTIKKVSVGCYTEKRSRFLAFALPVSSVDDVRNKVKDYEKKFYDARHVCYAYMIGADRSAFRANDNGEPSGTAGRPILGQINSFGLTNVLVIVVRYFGGIKLGTSGLAAAYKTVTALALGEADVIECTVDRELLFIFEYPYINKVMKAIKDCGAAIIEQGYDNSDCLMKVSIRLAQFEILKEKLLKIDSLRLK